MPHHQQDDDRNASGPLRTLLARGDGFPLAEARAVLAWRGSDSALAEYLKRNGFRSHKVSWAHGALLRFFPPVPAPRVIDVIQSAEEPVTLAARTIAPANPEMRSRLRRVHASMVSGPDVLAKRGRWRAFHLRAYREAFGDTGPARRGPNWTHLAAALVGAVIMLAVAGVHR